MRLFGEIRSWSRTKLALNGLSLVAVVVLGVFTARHFAQSGWPLAHANPKLAVASGLLFLAAYALKAYGWQRLFVPHERPGSLTLAAASGAACVGGVALPGRMDDAIRLAIVRKWSGTSAGIGTMCLSLFMLGLVDTVALTPFASTAAATGDVPIALRIGLAIVAFAGLGAAAVVIGLPRLSRSGFGARFRATRWLADRSICIREASKATVFVALSWLVRAAGLVLLLAALGFGLSLPLALVFLCAAAASGCLPIAPAGAATQAGAGAAVLVASGVSTTQAIGVAVAAQALVILAGAAVILFALAWRGGVRLRSRWQPVAA